MGPANFLVPAVLALYVPATYVSIRTLGPGRGVMAALLGGWLFLPVFDGRVDVPLLHTKSEFVATSALLVTAVADLQRWRRLKGHWVDLVAALVCIGPLCTALANDLGVYEGVSASLQAVCTWIAPYLLGRLYFGTPRALRDFAIWMVGAALVYVPLCLWEIRMSPQLHRYLYGYHAFEGFADTVRFGGYRPNAFMHFGLMLGAFMATGTLIAFWLWRSRAQTKIASLPLGWCTFLLAGTTVLIKSTGSVILLALGIAVLELTRALRRPFLILLLALAPSAFVTARIAGWDGGELVHAASGITAERAQSIEFRIVNERMLMEKALSRPWLGWGRWGRSRVYDAEDGRDISVTDSLWVILLGTYGLVGLTSMALLLLLPTLLFLQRFPARHWDHPAVSPGAALTLGTLLWVVDCLFNAMTSPIFPAICGATITFSAGHWSERRRTEPLDARRRLNPTGGNRRHVTLQS
jgi:hypothetical protein